MSDSWTTRPFDTRADGVDCNINTGGTGLAVIWVMVALALAVVATRLYTQARVTKQFGLSDWLMLASIATITSFASLISVQFSLGWGRHQACIQDVRELEAQIKFNITGQSFGIMGSTFGRMSFIVFIVSLFGSKRWVRCTLWAIFVAQIVTNVATVVMIYAQCKDPRALYDFSLPEDTCMPSSVQTYLGWAHTSFNGACDAFLSILPTAMVWNLHMATRLKIGVAALLGMSALGLVGLIMKCVYLDALSNEGDYSYNTVPMFTWTVVEGTLVATAASVPVLRPLYRRHLSPSARTASGAAPYDLPRYGSARRTGGSSGLSSSKARASGTPRYPALEGGSEDDDVALVLQHEAAPQRWRREQDCWPDVAAAPPERGILVRQEYTVTRGAEVGVEKGATAEAGVVMAQEDRLLVAPGEGGLPRPPARAWSRHRV